MCYTFKPYTEYYVHKQMADGYLDKCKECHKERIRNRRLEQGDYYRAYDRRRANNPDRVAARKAYAKSDVGKTIIDIAKEKWRLRNTDKRRAHIKVRRALLKGILTKTPCEVCGDSNVEGHHHDYALPLSVQWLCPTHHAELHRKHRNLPMDIPKPKSRRWSTV